MTEVLITATPEDEFNLAGKVTCMGVKTRHPDTEVLHKLRPKYTNNADSLTAASRCVTSGRGEV